MKKLTAKQRADNAIKWIDSLPDYKQANKISRKKLGNSFIGFCCLGAGCDTLGIHFKAQDAYNFDLVYKTGLINEHGKFFSGSYYKKSSLAMINDTTNAGFSRISTLMKRKPQLMFETEVAILIKGYYKRGMK